MSELVPPLPLVLVVVAPPRVMVWMPWLPPVKEEEGEVKAWGSAPPPPVALPYKPVQGAPINPHLAAVTVSNTPAGTGEAGLKEYTLESTRGRKRVVGVRGTPRPKATSVTPNKGEAGNAQMSASSTMLSKAELGMPTQVGVPPLLLPLPPLLSNARVPFTARERMSSWDQGCWATAPPTTLFSTWVEGLKGLGMGSFTREGAKV